jgi:hypothetical protein
MKNAVVLEVTLCGSCKNRRFGGTFIRNFIKLLVTADALYLDDEVTFSFEISVLTKATRRHIPEDGILLSHHRGRFQILFNFHILK